MRFLPVVTEHSPYTPASNSPGRAAVTAVVIITIVGAALRLYHLQFKSLWLDEAVLYWISNGSLAQIAGENAVQGSTPLLFPVLTAIMEHFGDSEYVLRAIPCVAGIAAIPLVFVLARQFVSDGLACFSSALIALAPAQIQYSQQLREYSLTCLLAVIVLLAFIRFMKQPTWTRALVCSIVMSLSVFIQYGLALLIAGIDVVWPVLIYNADKAKREERPDCGQLHRRRFSPV